jgi:CBS domain-containing protein
MTGQRVDISPLQTDVALFGDRVDDAMEAPPPLVAETLSCRDLVATLARADASCAIVIDDRQAPRGIVTEQDIVRRAAYAVDGGEPCVRIMTSPVHTVACGDPLYRAVGRMLELGLRRTPVLNVEGRVCGLLDLSRALPRVCGRVLRHFRGLGGGGDDDPQAARAAREAQAPLVEELLARQADAHEIQALLTRLNDDVYIRLADRRIALLESQGHGRAPTDFCLLLMGSGGRAENYLAPDQDHGLVLADYPDADHDRIDGWFQRFSEGLIEDLELADFPRDVGHVMCSNPLWRKTLSQWRTQIRIWARTLATVSIRLGDVFYDFRPVSGNLQLGLELRASLQELAAATPSLLRAMVDEHRDHGVGLGLFGRFVTMERGSAHHGHINLKHTAILPLITAVRVLALKHRVAVTGTLARLEALRDLEVIDQARFDSLKRAHGILSALVLRHQLAQVRTGETPDYYVHPGELDRAQGRSLRHALRSVRRLREQVRTDITGQVF